MNYRTNLEYFEEVFGVVYHCVTYDPEIYISLRGQTVLWIGAQFCVCMFLDSRDKSLNVLKFCRSDQRKVKNKRRKKGASLLRNPLTTHKMHSWPRNAETD